MQFNPNSLGNYLDLVLTTDNTMVEVIIPAVEDVFDRNSVNHNVIEVVMHLATPEEPVITQTFARNYKKARHTHIANMLANVPAVIVTDDMITADEHAEESQVIAICDEFVGYLKELLDENSPIIRKGTGPVKSSHPWLAGQQDFVKLEKLKNRLHKNYKRDGTPAAKLLYIQALKNARTEFDRLKIAYYEKTIEEGGETPSEFYNLMKFKISAKRTFSDRMVHEGTWYRGGDVVGAMAKSLLSNFDMSDDRLSRTHEENRSYLWDIYASNFDEEKQVLWDRYDGVISLEAVKEAITGLDLKKDPGPMQIPAGFLQNHIEFVIAHVRSASGISLRIILIFIVLQRTASQNKTFTNIVIRRRHQIVQANSE